MSNPKRPGQETERELRARISAGSQKLDDYEALADFLLDSPGREEEGLAVLEQALQLPLSEIQKARISADIAWFLYELGCAERAPPVAQRALAYAAGLPETPNVLMVRGLSHATLANCQYAADRAASDHNARLALDSFEKLLGQYPDFEDLAGAARYAAGVCVLQQEHEKAVALYEKALRMDASPRNRLYSLVCMGNALRYQDRYTEAEERLQDALLLIEADRRMLPRIHFELGKVRRLLGRSEEAMVALKQALASLELNPALRSDRAFVAEIRYELGNLYYEAQTYGEAIVALREALSDLLEAYPYLYCNSLVTLGHSYLVTGQYAQARDCYEEVLASDQASDPEKATAQEGLSRLPPVPPPTMH